jgi:SAM-dependent methyltransferase
LLHRFVEPIGAADSHVRSHKREIFSTMNWRDFWNGPHSIYVNERHKRLHYQTIAAAIVQLIDHSASAVLDYGCGEAGAADLVASKCGRLFLYDAATSVQQKLRQQFDKNPRIVVLSRQDLDALSDGVIDLIVANSLLQYLTAAELEALLPLWRRKLKPNGRLILADVIAPEAGALNDVLALMRFSIEGGFFAAAIVGLIRTFFSPYRRLRGQLGLARYHQDELVILLKRHGYDGQRATRNLGHDQTRMTIIAHRQD